MTQTGAAVCEQMVLSKTIYISHFTQTLMVVSTHSDSHSQKRTVDSKSLIKNDAVLQKFN